MVRSKVTIYPVIKDVIPNIKGLNTTNSAHFKQETFLRWAINQIVTTNFFSLGLSNFVVNHFSFRLQSFLILTILTIIAIFSSAKKCTYQVGKWKCDHVVQLTKYLM